MRNKKKPPDFPEGKPGGECVYLELVFFVDGCHFKVIFV